MTKSVAEKDPGNGMDLMDGWKSLSGLGWTGRFGGIWVTGFCLFLSYVLDSNRVDDNSLV